MVKVNFESKSHAEEVATFANEELYMACLPTLKNLAKNARMIVTEDCKSDPIKEAREFLEQRDELLDAVSCIIDAQYSKGSTLADLNSRVREAKELINKIERK